VIPGTRESKQFIPLFEDFVGSEIANEGKSSFYKFAYFF
jgi:hypothetical protein